MGHVIAGTTPTDVPNLTWKDNKGEVHVNPQTYLPSTWITWCWITIRWSSLLCATATC